MMTELSKREKRRAERILRILTPLLLRNEKERCEGWKVTDTKDKDWIDMNIKDLESITKKFGVKNAKRYLLNRRKEQGEK